MSASASSKLAAGDEDDDDYMNMTIQEPTAAIKETSIQRRARKQREAEIKSRARTRVEIAADEAAAREAALATSLDSSNKGFRMMAKLGFKGGALGKGGDDPNVRTEPIAVVMKDDRGGIGLEAEKKRRFREEVESETKRVKAEEGDYRERMRLEREVKIIEGQIIGAMVVAEKLDEEEEHKDFKHDDQKFGGAHYEFAIPKTPVSRPLKSINVLWRGLIKHRIEKERERRARYDLHRSLSRLPTYEDPDEDAESRHAMGMEEEEIEEEDSELDEFQALQPAVRLAKLVVNLRERHHYCFWCKCKYPDEVMEGCPGLSEEDHD